MIDREKVIKGLECCTTMDEQGFPSCEKCPYDVNGTCPDLDALHRDALTMLKEQRWRPFKERGLTDEEKIDHPGWCYILDCELPDDDEEVLVSNGKYVWVDTFINDGDECYLDSGHELDGTAWMPMPEPYKEAKDV